MRKTSAFIALLCVILILSTPFPLSGQSGVYNTFSGLYWCDDRSACIHEIGHKLDHQNDWISQSEGFSDAVKIFILSESKKEQPSRYLYNIFRMRDFTMAELYAQIFALSDGKQENMPEVFRKFYDWKKAAILMESVK